MKYVVISHTHWDREWYLPFEVFRLKLVDLVDRLLGILDRDSEYIFHLDAQTVVLEDYLEIRPSKREILKSWISRGNLVVGPWYLQNDFYLTSGEATVRNLLRGRRIAREFGKCSSVGYAPDQFGNVSQLPQILREFGIDNFIFGRGYAFYRRREDGEVERVPMPTEFLWEGADGTRALAVYLKDWYNNAQHIPTETEAAEHLLGLARNSFESSNFSPYVLLMNGVDHLEAQGDVREVIADLRARGHEIEQMRLDDVVAALKTYFEEHEIELPVYSGALLNGRDSELLRGCWALRVYLKSLNVRAQTLLSDMLEPLYAILEAEGMRGAYPADQLAYLWKSLLRNHPHDSICGCARDEVAAHMEDRYARIREAGGELLKRGLELVAGHAAHPARKPENYVVALCNPTEERASDVVELEMHFPRGEGVERFSILDPEGNEVPFAVLGREKGYLAVFSPVNLPGTLDVDTWRVLVGCKDLPAHSVCAYAVVPGAQSQPVRAKEGLENEFYRIDADGGRIDILCKKSGVTVRDAIRFEDVGDRGESYVCLPAGDVVAPEPALASVKVKEDNPLRKTLRVEHHLRLPKRFDFAAGRRSEASVIISVAFELTLKKNCDILELSYEIDNRAEDHRLRIGIDTAILADCVWTDSPYDVAAHTPEECCCDTQTPTFCNATFAAVRGEGRGFAVLTEGQHEVERVGSVLWFTLLRATGVIVRGDTGAEWFMPEGQCKRRIAGRLGLYGFADDSAGQLSAKAKLFRTGILAKFSSMDARKFAGGRPAVQDSKLSQLYFLPDPYEGIALPTESAFRYGNKNIAVTAAKLAENGEGIVVRLVNLSEESQRTKFSAAGEIFETCLAEDSERRLGANAVELEFGPKKIRTLVVRKKEGEKR